MANSGQKKEVKFTRRRGEIEISITAEYEETTQLEDAIIVMEHIIADMKVFRAKNPVGL